jgi:hypothetical protein
VKRLFHIISVCLVSALGFGSVAPRLQKSAAIAPETSIEIAGVYQRPVGAVLVLLARDGEVSGWISEGSTWSGHTYLSFDSSAGEAIVRSPNGELNRISLRSAKVTKTGTSQEKTELLPPEKIDWAWVSSEKNPMRKRAVDLPFEIVMEWDTYTDADKIPLINYYRSHGWNLSVTHQSIGIRVRLEPLDNPANPRSRVRPPESLISVPIKKK